MASVLVDTPDGWELPVGGWTVTRCFVDPAAFGLLVDGGTGDILRVYLEAPFAFTASNGESETFGGSHDPLSFAPLLRLMGRAVSAVKISPNSDLAIEFADGSKLEAAPIPKFEAWGIEGLGKLLIHSPPGGGDPQVFE